MTSKNKTTETELSVEAYLEAIESEDRRADCQTILNIMQRITGMPPKMWGSSIVGFGLYHYKYDSGREGDSLRIGFSSRVQNISIYIMPGYQDFEDELSRLGKYKKGKSCLYLKQLSDVDLTVLEAMFKKGLALLEAQYPL